MAWFTVSFECVEDSIDWGKKGATNKIGNLEAETPEEACKKAEEYKPTNWIVTGAEIQEHRYTGVQDGR